MNLFNEFDRLINKPLSFVITIKMNGYRYMDLTGVAENFTKDLRVYEYPDWMEKPDKPCYKSTSVVGNCYRICRSLAAVSFLLFT